MVWPGLLAGPQCREPPAQATNITSTSAIISWLPSNSNFQHTVRK
jgi:hypothetical protein